MLLLVSNAELIKNGLDKFYSVAHPVIPYEIIHLLIFLARHVLSGLRQKCIQINWCLVIEVLDLLKKVLYIIS